MSITVKQMKDWLSDFSDDDYVYIDSFNPIVAHCGGWDLTTAFVNQEMVKEERKDCHYLQNGDYLLSGEANGIKCYDDNEINQEAEKIMKYIQNNMNDWSKSKIEKELEKLDKFTKSFKKSPVIFVNN